MFQYACTCRTRSSVRRIEQFVLDFHFAPWSQEHGKTLIHNTYTTIFLHTVHSLLICLLLLFTQPVYRDVRGIVARFPRAAKDLPLLKYVQTGYRVYPISYSIVSRGSIPNVKRPERESHHSPKCSAEIKNGCSYTSNLFTPPCCTQKLLFLSRPWIRRQKESGRKRSTTVSNYYPQKIPKGKANLLDSNKFASIAECVFYVFS